MLFLSQKIRTFKEKKGDFLAIDKENVVQLQQKPIAIFKEVFITLATSIHTISTFSIYSIQ